MEPKKCPECGSKEIGLGKWGGYAALMPLGKFFTIGSKVMVDVCTDCGYIIGLKAENPKKFK